MLYLIVLGVTQPLISRSIHWYLCDPSAVSRASGPPPCCRPARATWSRGPAPAPGPMSGTNVWSSCENKPFPSHHRPSGEPCKLRQRLPATLGPGKYRVRAEIFPSGMAGSRCSHTAWCPARGAQHEVSGTRFLAREVLNKRCPAKGARHEVPGIGSSSPYPHTSNCSRMSRCLGLSAAE